MNAPSGYTLARFSHIFEYCDAKSHPIFLRSLVHFTCMTSRSWGTGFSVRNGGVKRMTRRTRHKLLDTEIPILLSVWLVSGGGGRDSGASMRGEIFKEAGWWQRIAGDGLWMCDNCKFIMNSMKYERCTNLGVKTLTNDLKAHKIYSHSQMKNWKNMR